MITTANLISGGGSTSLAVIKAQEPGGILHGLVKTLAIISSDENAIGIQKAIDFGFPEENIRVANPKKGDLAGQLLKILVEYNPHYFHQLGWMPWTPTKVIQKFTGLNQHLGPDGKFMHGERRIFAHLNFCMVIGEKRLIPVFCQFVHPKYDQGDIIHVEFVDFDFAESVSEIATRLLPIEHRVQIEALRLLALGKAMPLPVPLVYRTLQEQLMMEEIRVKTDQFYRKHYDSKTKIYFSLETHSSPRLRLC
jgi:folate-dependent phosphoribosylglycinamide formyltransferase PurN